MPGLCGVVSAGDGGGPLVGSMAAAMCHYDWHVRETAVAGPLALARVSIAEAAGAAPPQAAWFADDGSFAVGFDGELHAAGDAPAEWDSTPARRLLEGIRGAGPSALAGFHGCFAAAIWNRSARELSLANDRFGMRPMYWTQVGSDLLFAAEVEALFASPGVSRAFSPEGVGQFFSFGHFLGDATLYAGVRALPPGAWLTWNADTRRVTVGRYDELPASSGPRSDAEWLDAISSRFRQSVAQCCRGDRMGLSLSGGLDARTILGAAPREVPLTCVSLGVPGGIDHRAASRLAALAGRAHHAHVLDGDFLARFEPLFRQTVKLTYGHYVDQGIVLSALPAYRALGIRTLLRGHAGELMHMRKAYAFSLDDEALRATSPAAVRSWLWDHLSGYMIGAADQTLWSGGAAAGPPEAARASLERDFADAGGEAAPLQSVWRLFVEQRLRRETAVSMHLFRSFVEVRLPYLEPALVATIFAAPVALKLSDAIQVHILRACHPEFLHVVNANTGAPMAAGRLRTRLAHLKLRALSKLRVPGYQPYERLGLWLARELQPLLRRALLSDAFLDQKIFERDGVVSMLEQHARRDRNHTFLLMAMLVFALGHCEQ